MIFHTPEFLLGTLQPPQSGFQPKFGGHPWGFPLPKWPSCAGCGQPMAFLAQIPHVPGVIDLGDPALVLHLFQCLTDGGGSCEHWSHSSGANACVFVRRDELSDCLVTSPGTSGLIGELWITGWRREEDPVAPTDYAAYFDSTVFWALPEELQFPKNFEPRWSTKAGGPPYWTGNGPLTLPPKPYEYLLQFDNLLYLVGPLPEADAAGCDVQVNGADDQPISLQKPGRPRPNAPRIIMQEHDRPDEYSCEITNLGTDGIGYVFIDRSRAPARAVWFWNR